MSVSVRAVDQTLIESIDPVNGTDPIPERLPEPMKKEPEARSILCPKTVGTLCRRIGYDPVVPTYIEIEPVDAERSNTAAKNIGIDESDAETIEAIDPDLTSNTRNDEET